MKTKVTYWIVFLSLGFLSPRGIAQEFSESNLPIVLINTFGQVIPDDYKITAEMKIIDNGPGQINHVSDPPTWYDGSIGIEVRGASSSWYPQKPYALETRDALGNDLNVSLFGWPAESDYVLLSHYGDKALVRNELSFMVSARMGQYASRFVWCEVLLNGNYDGIYLFGEKIKRDSSRVNIAKLTPEDTTGVDLTGGYIFKIDYWDNTNSWLSPYHPIGFPGFDIHYVYYYPKPVDILFPQGYYIASYVTAFEEALYGPDFTDPELGYRKYVDVPSFIDYFLVNEVSRNNDGFKKSYYFHKDRDDRNPLIKAGPVWDFDWAWKNIDECYIFQQTDGSGWAYEVNNCYPDVNSPGHYIRLFQDDAFQNELKCRWETLRSDILNTDTILNWIDQKMDYLWDAQQRHFERYPISQNWAIPEVPPIPQTYQGEIDKLKQWIILRMNWLEANMPGICYTGLPNQAKEKTQPLAFPNPASDMLWIESRDFSSGTTIKFFDLTGAEIRLPFRFDGITFTVEVKELSEGIYFYKTISRPGEIKSGKFMIRQ